MPDRMLSAEEKSELRQESPETHLFKASEIVANYGGEPSLHDLSIIELLGKIDGLEIMVIKLGRKIRKLEKK